MFGDNSHKNPLLTDENSYNSSSNQLEAIDSATFGKRIVIHGNEEEDSRRSFSTSFHAMNPQNSAKLTIFLLINTMIGSGILNQPFVFKESGIIGGLLGFTLASIATWTGLLCLTEAGIYADVLEYSGLAYHAFKRHGERLVDVAIIILAFGAQLGYILVVGTTLSSLLKSWGCDSDVCGNIWTTIISVAVFVAPVCMFRHFGHLAYLSLFSIAAIVAVLLLVLIGGPIKHRTEHVADSYNVFNIEGLMSSTGSIVFALSCASANFQAFITTEKKSQNLESWSFITGSSVFVGAFMCMIMGIAGYLSFGSGTDGMILDNFTQHGFDFFKLMVVTHLILYIPVNFVIMRYSLVKITSGKRSELLPFSTHTILTLGLLVVITAIVILLLSLGLASGEAFSLILDLSGGIGGSLATLILPAAIYIKVMPSDSKMYWTSRVLLLFGFFVMIAVVAETVIKYAG
jgi:sodium-coupled neutral amino acid transporter 11